MSESISKKFLLVLALLAFSPILICAQTALVNINTAGLETLKTLNGIGDVKAQAIINYRTQNGPFSAIEDIQNVSGIGATTYANIRDFITVGTAQATNELSATQNENTIAEIQSTSSSNSSSSKSIWFVDNKSSQLEIDIGKDRSGAVGSPIEFEAETNFGSSKSSIFEWKFGDGSIEYGPVITHTYMFPGEYVVILSVKVFSEVIVSRINVKVISPDLLISIANPDRIEITNNSKSEVNLFGRTLVSNGKIFPYPKDTIILSGQKISFSSIITGLTPLNISNVYLMTVGDDPNKSYNSVNKSEEVRLKQISMIQSQVTELQSKLAVARSYIPAPKSVPQESVAEESESEDISPLSISATALSAIIEQPERSGWLAKLRRFFLRTQ